MRALVIGTLLAFAFAGSARAQVVAPDDGPAPPQYPAPQQNPPQQQYPAPQQYQPPPGYVLVPQQQPISEQELAELEAHGRRFRAIGAVLVALGAICDIAGLALIIDYYANNTPNGSHDWESYASLGLGLASAGLLGAGIPILSSGIRDVRRAQRIREGRVAWGLTGAIVKF
jgi:hypothetical protein